MRARFILIIALTVITHNGWSQILSAEKFHVAIELDNMLGGSTMIGWNVSQKSSLGVCFSDDYYRPEAEKVPVSVSQFNGAKLSYNLTGIGPLYSYTIAAEDNVRGSLECAVKLSYGRLSMQAYDDRCRIWRDIGDSGGAYENYFYLFPKREKAWPAHLGIQLMLAFRINWQSFLTATVFARYEVMDDPIFNQLDKSLAMASDWGDFGKYYKEPVVNIYRTYTNQVESLRERRRFLLGFTIGLGI